MIDRLLLLVARLAARRPWTVIAVAALLTVVAATTAALRLDMNANTDDLIAADRPYMRTYRKFLDEFGDLEFIHAVVAAEDSALAEKAVDALSERIARIEGIPAVFSGVEPDEQLRIAVHAMTDAELAAFHDARAALPEVLSGRGPGSVVKTATAMLKRLTAAGAVMNADRRRELGGGALFLLHALAAGLPDAPLAAELATLSGRVRRRAYLTTDNGRLHLLNIMPVKDYGTLAVIDKPLAEIRAAVAMTKRDHPGVEIGVTGKPVLQADEMTTTNVDMTRASILGLILTVIPFMVVIGGIARPALAAAAFASGLAWTFGLVAVTVGSLNLLSVVFVPILVGIGLDFGVHIVIRYLEERRKGEAHQQAIETALLTSGRGNITGALTQCAAFYTAMLTDFQGLRELGFVAGSGLVICLAAITVVLPALLEVHERRRLARGLPFKAGRIAPKAKSVGGAVLRRPRTVLLLAVAATVAAFPLLFRLRFEENLLELQAKGLDSIEWEHRIMANSDDSVWFGGAVASTLDEVLTITKKAKALPSVGSVRSVFEAVKPPTEARTKLVADILAAARDDSKRLGTPATPLDAVALQEAIAQVDGLARLSAKEAPAEAATMKGLADALRGLEKRLRDPATADAARIETETVAATVSRNVGTMLAGAALPIVEALPAAVRSQFVSKNGRFLVMVHPKDDIWEMAPLERFVAELTTIHPTATGSPVTHLESIRDMKRGFLMVAIYSILTVFALVWFDFRSFTDTALAAIPLFAGLLWTVIAMGAFDVSFNLANFFAAPILIGICVDNGVHILHRYREGGPDRLTLASTARAIVLTSLNNVLGFGCMATATHRGLQSLGIVMGMGAFFCMVSSLVILPPLLAVMESRRSRRRSSP